MNTLDDVKPIGQKIVFRFLDEAGEKGFTNTTSWNFLVKSHEDTSKAPRWAKVYLKGPDVSDSIEIGDYVLIEALMWTHSFKINDIKYWATDYEKIIGQLKEAPNETF